MQRAFLCAPATDISLYRLDTPYLVGSVRNVSACHKNLLRATARCVHKTWQAGQQGRQAVKAARSADFVQGPLLMTLFF